MSEKKYTLKTIIITIKADNETLDPKLKFNNVPRLNDIFLNTFLEFAPYWDYRAKKLGSKKL